MPQKDSKVKRFINANHAKYTKLLAKAGPGLFSAEEQEKYLGILKGTEFENLTLTVCVLNLLLAHEMRKLSHDPKTQTGAILSDKDGNPIYGGYNGLPFETPLNGVMKEKFCTNWENNFNNEFRYDTKPMGRGMWHAEPNTVYNATYNGYTVAGNALFLPWWPCRPCEQVVVASGIKLYVHSTESLDFNDPHWGAGWLEVANDFKAAGVITICIPDEVVGRVLSAVKRKDLNLGTKVAKSYLDFYKEHHIERFGAR